MMYKAYAITTERLGEDALVTDDDIIRVNELLQEGVDKRGLNCSIRMARDCTGFDQFNNEPELEEIVDEALSIFLEEA